MQSTWCCFKFLNIRYSSDLQKLYPKDPRFGIRTQRSCHLYYSHGGGGRWLFNKGTFAWSSHNRGTFIAVQGCRMSTPLPKFLISGRQIPWQAKVVNSKTNAKGGKWMVLQQLLTNTFSKFKRSWILYWKGIMNELWHFKEIREVWPRTVWFRTGIQYYIYHRKICVKVMNSKQDIT